MECAYHIRLFSELLCFLAELRLSFEIFLEVVLACLTIEVEQVVELLNVELIVAPGLARFLGRHRPNLFPFLLQRLEGVV